MARQIEKSAGTRHKLFRHGTTLMATFEQCANNITRAVEDELRLWLARAKHRPAKQSFAVLANTHIGPR